MKRPTSKEDIGEKTNIVIVLNNYQFIYKSSCSLVGEYPVSHIHIRYIIMQCLKYELFFKAMDSCAS